MRGSSSIRFLFLLCALLIAVSTASFTCVACDTLQAAHQHGHSEAEGAVPAGSIDLCSGICSCCSFHLMTHAGTREAALPYRVVVRAVSMPAPHNALQLPPTPPPRS